MRRRRFLWVASLLAISLSACTTLQPPRLEIAKACTEWRWIGISKPEARCPEIRGWTVRPLFPQLAPVSREPADFCAMGESEMYAYCKERESEHLPSAELIRKLNRFCVYEPADPRKGTEHLPFPPSESADLVKFDQDCAAISSTDREIDPDDREDGRSFLPREPEKTLKSHKGGVRLAFLDTQPTGKGVPLTSGRSQHGFTLAHLAKQLLCAPGSDTHCAAQITTRLALPIVKFDPKTLKNNEIDETLGGFIGLQSDLAKAIRDEVDDWKKAKAQQHLVLNLSVAWDGNFFGGLGQEQIAEMRAGTQAVYYALQYAASYDVLVLAAAGNQRIEPCSNFGPLLPAAWEMDPPQEGLCSLEPRQHPFIYAVGGVLYDGSPLPNSRYGGMPRRAAYGETPILLSINPDTVYKKKLYVGTSVATAYASSIAAAVWSSNPRLDSHEVMRLLDGSGPSLPFSADFWFGDRPATPPSARLLSLCTAMEKTCAGAGPCPIELPCPSMSFGPLASARPPEAEVSSRGSCQPWLHPQPDDPPCLNQYCPPSRGSN